MASLCPKPSLAGLQGLEIKVWGLGFGGLGLGGFWLGGLGFGGLGLRV